MPKNAIFWFFGQNFPKSAKKRRKCGAENGVFKVIRDSSENQFGQPKKKVDKLFEFFLKVRPQSRKS